MKGKDKEGTMEKVLKIAIVGSKRTKFANPKAVEMLAEFLDKNIIGKPVIIAPGCPMNRDSWVRDYAVSRQLTINEYDPPGPLGIRTRNQRVVDECDELWAFWAGDSQISGTLDIVRIAAASGKPFKLFIVKEDHLEQLPSPP